MPALDDNDYDAIMARIELLEERGPGVGRPVVDHRGQPPPEHERAPRRLETGVIRVRPAAPSDRAVGGDKRDDWTGWHKRNIPRADDLLNAHLDSMRKESR